MAVVWVVVVVVVVAVVVEVQVLQSIGQSWPKSPSVPQTALLTVEQTASSTQCGAVVLVEVDVVVPVTVVVEVVAVTVVEVHESHLTGHRLLAYAANGPLPELHAAASISLQRASSSLP